MATALTIIKKAMQKAGVLTKAETPASDEASDALDTLNDMLASWSNDSLTIYARVTESFPLSSGDATYTIGSGGDFDTVRPIKIIEAHTRLGTTDYPMTLVSDTIFQGITYKNTGSTPTYLNYTNAYPLATLNFYPIPPGGYTLFLTSEKELAEFTLNQTISLPPGWRRALIHNLAVELQMEYGQQPNPLLLKIAGESKGEISKPIMRARTMDAQPYGALGIFNIYRGYQ